MLRALTAIWEKRSARIGKAARPRSWTSSVSAAHSAKSLNWPNVQNLRYRVSTTAVFLFLSRTISAAGTIDVLFRLNVPCLTFRRKTTFFKFPESVLSSVKNVLKIQRILYLQTQRRDCVSLSVTVAFFFSFLILFFWERSLRGSLLLLYENERLSWCLVCLFFCARCKFWDYGVYCTNFLWRRLN